LMGGLGNDALDGGEGIDTASYPLPLTSYQISLVRNGSTKITFTGPTIAIFPPPVTEGTDTLVNVERVEFAGVSFDLVNPPRTETPKFGQSKGFLFDPSYYLLSQPQLAGTVTMQGALDHYLKTGAAAGAKPNDWFDAGYYANRWSDLKALNLSADVLFQHYNLYGVWEVRSAGPRFDTYDGLRYLRDNPDVAAYVDAYVNDFLGSRSNGAIAHYVIYGAAEGRVAYNQQGEVIDTAMLIGISPPGG